MKNSTLIHDITPEQLISMFQDLQHQLAELKKNFEPKVPTEYLTRAEVKKLLKCDLSTIHNWCKKGKLKPVGIGSRVYFKRSDIEAVLVPLNGNN